MCEAATDKARRSQLGYLDTYVSCIYIELNTHEKLHGVRHLHIHVPVKLDY